MIETVEVEVKETNTNTEKEKSSTYEGLNKNQTQKSDLYKENLYVF